MDTWEIAYQVAEFAATEDRPIEDVIREVWRQAEMHAEVQTASDGGEL